MKAEDAKGTSAAFKTAERAKLAAQGVVIIANLGDQAGALESYGKAERIWLDLASATPLTRPMELALAPYTPMIEKTKQQTRTSRPVHTADPDANPTSRVTRKIIKTQAIMPLRR